MVGEEGDSVNEGGKGVEEDVEVAEAEGAGGITVRHSR